MKQALFLTVLFAVLTGAAYATRDYVIGKKLEGPAAPETVDFENIPEPTEESLPSTLNIELPFYAQAPFGNWDYPWQEACEEASVLLVANLYKEMGLSREAFNEELLRLVDWEMQYFGAYEHTSVDQTVEMIELQYELETVVHENPSFEDMQAILADGHLIVAPFAGKVLGNPNYQNGGPIYHMVVIKGYDAEKMQIVTHDVGTRNGADYVYSWATVEEALHDWHPSNILEGDPRIIEVLPN